MSSQDLPKRKNIRLSGYDYSQNGAYFVTICTRDRAPLFGEIVGVVGLGGLHIARSHTGKIINHFIASIPANYNNVSIPVYCVMPNHIHFIVLIDVSAGGPPRSSAPTPTIPQIINALKSLATKQAGQPLWQRGYYEHIIRTEQDYRDIWQYIETNPVEWADDQYHQA